jgi:hypothetical protein
MKALIALAILVSTVAASDLLAPAPVTALPQVTHDLEKKPANIIEVHVDDVVVTPERRDAMAFLSLMEVPKLDEKELVRECPRLNRECN